MGVVRLIDVCYPELSAVNARSMNVAGSLDSTTNGKYTTVKLVGVIEVHKFL